jgi:hypothetical protein
MATTISPFTWYSKATKNLSLGTILTDDIKLALVTSTYSADFTNHEFFDVDVTNELPTLNGYTAGGFSLTGKTLPIGVSTGEWHFLSDNPYWTAATGQIVARAFVLYNNTPATNKPLIGYGFLDFNNGSPQDVTTQPTFNLTVLVPATGWFYTQKVNG